MFRFEEIHDGLDDYRLHYLWYNREEGDTEIVLGLRSRGFLVHWNDLGDLPHLGLNATAETERT